MRPKAHHRTIVYAPQHLLLLHIAVLQGPRSCVLVARPKETAFLQLQYNTVSAPAKRTRRRQISSRDPIRSCRSFASPQRAPYPPTWSAGGNSTISIPPPPQWCRRPRLRHPDCLRCLLVPALPMNTLVRGFHRRQAPGLPVCRHQSLAACELILNPRAHAASSTPLICELCGATKQTRYLLKIHTFEVHDTDKTDCPMCLGKFPDREEAMN